MSFSISRKGITSPKRHTTFRTEILFRPPGSPTLWLDSTNIDGQFNKTFINSSAITTWVNKGSISTTGNFTQATTNDKPLYKTQIQNGKPGVLFDGSSDFMATTATSANVITSTLCTIFVVARTSAFSAGSSAPNGAGIIVDSGSYWQINTKTNGTYNTSIYDGNYDEASSSVKTVGITYILTMQHIGGNITLAVNNDTTVTAASGTMQDTSNILNLGRSGAGGGVKWNGHLFEVIIYNIALSPSNISLTKGYLKNKYKL